MTDSLSTIRHLIHPLDPNSAGSAEIYRCPKGDLWELVKAPSNPCSMVRHTPNPASGIAPTTCTVEEFLAVNSAGPEHAALRILLTTAAAAQPGG